MDSEKKWGCIGYALLALITWGLTQGFKVVCIIIGILIAILIAFIFISNLSTKRLIKKFKHQKDIYPNAYSFFRKELRIFQSENNLTKQDINKFLSFPKVEWEKREKLELERIQREKQVSTEYNMIKANYSDGLTCWQKEHPSANKSIIISNITEIIDFDRRQKEFLSTEEWEKAQIAFSKLCRSKKSTTPHSGCYFYNMNFHKTDYKGNIIQGEYRIWQFFFSSFCTATDLDYTHFKQTQENNINIDKYKEGKINTPSYINIEISNFIKSLGVPVQVIADGAEFDVLEIKDGVQLYRNPVQTMDKIKSLIPGLKNEDSLDSFWEGAISDSKLGTIPVYVPNLMDSASKLLDKVTMNRIIHQAIPELDNDIKKAIVYYIDITDEVEIMNFIKEDDSTTVEIELRDLKSILDDVVIGDYAEFHAEEIAGGYAVAIDKFMSDRVLSKIAEFNQKAFLNSSAKKPYKPIEISEEGLELIEFLSLDCTATGGEWHSDSEIKIDKNGYVIVEGNKTKEFWDGYIRSTKKPLRLKIRNICGDETVWEV